MHGRLTIFTALLIALALPAGATADTTVGGENGTVVIEDAAGVANDLTVARLESPARLQVVEAGATPLQAVAPCTQQGTHEVRCPEQVPWQVTARLGGGDDRVETEADVNLGADGGDGDDVLVGGLGRDWLSGGGGDDVLAGRGGRDHLRGGDGDDHLDGWSGTDVPDEDERLDCGAGDDDADPEAGEDTTSGCEVIAPEFVGVPGIAGTFVVGSAIWPALDESALSGTWPTERVATWLTCDPAACTPVGTGWELRLPAHVATKRLVAGITVRNRAGEDSVTTAETPAISLAPVPPGPPKPPRPPRVPRLAPKPVETPAALLARARAELTQQIGPLTTLLARRDPRKIGPRGVTLAIVPPANGQFGARWTVPAATARRYGVRVTGARPVTVARATRPGVSRGFRAPFTVVPTAAGRTLLARAPKLRLTLHLRLVPRSVKQAVEVSAPFTLRRR